MATKERPSRVTPKTMVIGGVLLVALVVVIYLNLGIGSGGPALAPEEVTRNELARLQSQAISFVATEQRVPATLDEIVPTGNKLDGWKSPFEFVAGTEGPMKASFVLRSIGKDKQADTPDDWTVKVVFADDGYRKLGNEQVTKVEPQ